MKEAVFMVRIPDEVIERLKHQVPLQRLEKEFAAAAEKAVRASHFKVCARKTLTLIFHYELGDFNKGDFPQRFQPAKSLLHQGRASGP